MVIKNQSLLSAILAVIPILLFHFAQSLDIENAKDLACFKPEKTATTDLQWLASVKKWYYVMGSRLDLYQFAADVTNKDPEEILEDELYYESCLSWEPGPDLTFVGVGFGGSKKSYKVKPLDNGAFEFSAVDGGISATGYFTLTDNKTFYVSVTCYPDSNEMTWNVASPLKSLPKKTLKKIQDHVESLGFKRKHFTGLRYDSCDKKGASKGKREL